MSAAAGLLVGVSVLAALAGLSRAPRPQPERRPTAEHRPAPEPIAVSVVIRTTAGLVTLSDADARALSPVLRATVQGCSYNSVDDPEVFRGLEPARVWADRAARPHVAARFTTPFEIAAINGTRRQATELLIPHRPDYWLVRDGHSILLLTKCSGSASIALDCSPVLRPHLRPDQEICRLFEESLHPRPRP